MKECMSKPSKLFRKEKITYASGLVFPITTALFFDKIWIPEHKDISIMPRKKKCRYILESPVSQ